jgi:hypothetical protein
MYSWQHNYIAAILETDNAKGPRRLYEAIAESTKGSSVRSVPVRIYGGTKKVADCLKDRGKICPGVAI